MDEKNNYDFDISESWSIIDINQNEESLPALVASIESGNNSESELKKEKLNKTNVTELENFVRKCKEVNQTDFSQLSDSDSDCSFKNEGLQTVSRTALDEIDNSQEKSSENDRKQDSADTESIEILDIDDSELERLSVSQIDHYDFTTYQSDDEESLEGIEENKSNNLAVIKRRRRSKKSVEESVHSVNSKNPRPVTDNATYRNNRKRQSVTLNDEESNCQTVYKHNRNNAANTILSLSVGFFFAGVAGIAIGHYLGFQYATESAWQKQQVEKVALQTPLCHSNKGLPSEEKNSELELLLSEPGSKLSGGQIPSKVDGSKESELRYDLDSMEWLSKLEDLVENKKATDTKFQGLDLKLTHKREHSVGKRVEDADKKILKLVRKIHNWMSTSQDGIQKLGEGLNKLQSILNLSERSHGKSKRRKRVPVTELDLQSMNWNTKEEISKSHPESIVLYEFPKPESYYQESRNSSRVSEHSEANETRNKKKYDRKMQDKKQSSKDNCKRKKWEENESEPKKHKKRRTRVGKIEKIVEKNQNRLTKQRLIKLGDLNSLNGTIYQKKKHSNKGEKKAKTKRKAKKVKKPTLKKVWSPKNQAFFKRKNYNRKYSGTELFNLTGYWVFRWADGRKEFRRHEALGEWQFERAKARRDSRDDHFEENWQFKRALGRETNRWSHGKYPKYTGKKFMHDGFSWI